MKMSRTKLLIALAASSITSTSLADSTFVSTPYLGVDLGYSRVKDEAQATANALVSSLGGAATVTQDTSAFLGRLFAGYKITENLDVEIAYQSTNSINNKFTGVTSGGFAYTGSTNVTVSGFDYAALLRPSISSGYNNVYFRIGGTNFDTKGSTNVNGFSTSLETSGSGMQYGIGYDSDISPDLISRIAITQYTSISGVSKNDTTVFSLGIFKKF